MNSNMNKNNNLDKYVDELYSQMRINFESILNKLYSEELNKYSELIDFISKLPFVQAIIEENNKLKEELKKFENNNNNCKIIIIIVFRY